MLAIKKTEHYARCLFFYLEAFAGLFLYVPHSTHARWGSLGLPQFEQMLIEGLSNFQFVRLFNFLVVETLLFGTAIVYTSYE